MHAIVIWFDRLPYGLLGCCGNTGATTPGFDRLAAESVTFDRCFAADVTTNGSIGMARLLADHSRDGAAVRLVTEGNTILAEELALLPTESHAVDISTHAVIDASAIAGLFLAYCEVRDRPSSLTVLSLKGVPSAVLDWHATHVADAIAAADNVLVQIMDGMRALRNSDDLLLLVTAAAGLAPDKSSGAPVRPRLSEHAIHVPLFGRMGTPMKFGVRCSSLISTSDVWTTLSNHIGRPATVLGGRDLGADLLGGKSPQRETLVIRGPQQTYGFRTDEWYLMTEMPDVSQDNMLEQAAESASLFMKPDDLWDQLDVAGQSRDVVETLVSRLVEACHADGVSD